jgi:RimJ/RimL family protein N-acetyltransferase
MQEERVTERLLARPPCEADRDAYLSLFLDPAVGEWLRPPPLEPFDRPEVLQMLVEDRWHWEEHGFGPWVLIEREGGGVVGRGGLRWTELNARPAVELPWTIASADWGRGLATEAAEAAIEYAVAQRLREVVALVAPTNLRSRRVAEKVGLSLDGETRHVGLPHLVYRRRLDGSSVDRSLSSL